MIVPSLGLAKPECDPLLPSVAHEMDEHALEYLDKNALLEPGEELRAHYDATVSMDGTEAAILTDRRVLRASSERALQSRSSPV